MRTDFPRRAEDVRELGELIGRAFIRSYERLETFPRRFAENPSIRLEFQRILRRRGRIVAHVGIHEKILRIGRARIRMGGIAAVACDPNYRRQGLAAACMKDALALLKRERFPLSLLFGIERYYLRFGYVGCLPGYVLRVGAVNLSGLKNTLRVSPYTPGAQEDLVGLYHAAAESTPGSVVRDVACMAYALRNWRLVERTSESPEGKVFLFYPRRGKRRLRAYVVWEDGALLEAGMVPGDEEACVAVLAWLRDRRVAALEKEVPLTNLCPAHPLWIYAQRFNHAGERKLSWSGGGMGRLIDVGAFLEALRPELEARLNSAGLESECHLHLVVDGHEHSLILGRAHQLSLSISTHRLILYTRLECSSQALLQMALGTLPFEALPGIKVEGERSLLRAAFPCSNPHLYRLDHF